MNTSPCGNNNNTTGSTNPTMQLEGEELTYEMLPAELEQQPMYLDSSSMTSSSKLYHTHFFNAFQDDFDDDDLN